MNQLISPSLVERRYRMREAMQDKDGKLTTEQEAQIAAVSAMYADMDQAIVEMMKIRNMDPDSRDVPLPNACSANSGFVRNIRRNIMGHSKPDSEDLTYRTGKQAELNPEQHLEYIISHFDALKAEKLIPADLNAGYFQDLLSDMRERKRELTRQELDSIIMITVQQKESPGKYAYHRAANIGKTKNGSHITTEGFAAETKQYMVSPFTTEAAVGIYHGEEKSETYLDSLDFVNQGMVDYYNHDNPLPNAEEEVYVEIKGKLASNQLPGGAV